MRALDVAFLIVMAAALSVIVGHIFRAETLAEIPRECPGKPIAVYHYPAATYCHYAEAPYSAAITSSKAKRQEAVQ